MSDHGPGGSPRDAAWAVIDIDGVLADVRHRLHHLGSRPRDWESFFAAMGDDGLLAPGAESAHQAHDDGLAIAYLTGRPERYRAQTLSWLKRWGLPSGRLLMRPDRDRRPAAIFKLEILSELGSSGEVSFLLDDDEAVLAAAREAGYAVRHADWMGREEALRQAQEVSGRT